MRANLHTQGAAAGQLAGLSVFSGCGGLDLGAARAGVQIVYALDSMPEAADAIGQLLPDTDFECADIRRVRALPQADIVLGGYPCQPFSSGGARTPSKDVRSTLFQEFARAIDIVEPAYFVAENVVGLARQQQSGRRRLDDHLEVFANLGRYGYELTWKVINAADYGVPQRRRRIFVVGVRADLGIRFHFPSATHARRPNGGLKAWQSHGDALLGLPLDPVGEYYQLDDERNWPWYYMSRNRKAEWDDPSFTVIANERHATLHPASPVMRMAWQDLADGWKQGWEFTNEYEHLDGHPSRPRLERPRRLSWRECAVLQTFPTEFEPLGTLRRKYEQIGNAVPPLLAEAIVKAITDGSGLTPRG